MEITLNVRGMTKRTLEEFDLIRNVGHFIYSNLEEIFMIVFKFPLRWSCEKDVSIWLTIWSKALASMLYCYFLSFEYFWVLMSRLYSWNLCSRWDTSVSRERERWKSKNLKVISLKISFCYEQRLSECFVSVPWLIVFLLNVKWLTRDTQNISAPKCSSIHIFYLFSQSHV